MAPTVEQPRTVTRPQVITQPRVAEEVYRRHSPGLYRLCLAHLHNPADAEDAVQETFLRAAPRLAQLSGDPAAYLTVVARNICRDEHRRRRRQAGNGATEDSSEPDAPSCPETAVVSRSTLRQVWSHLSNRDRALLTYHFCGLSCDEISRRFGMSVNATAVALSRARQQARRMAAAVLLPLAGWRALGRLFRRAGQTRAEDALVTTAGAQQLGAAVAAMMAGLVLVSSTGITAPSQQPGTAATARDTTSTLRGAPAPPRAHPGAAGRARLSATRSGQDTVSPPRPFDPVGGVIDPGRDAQQGDAAFPYITPSPHYAAVHTVFASGILANGCSRPVPCPVLFRSDDGGSSWRRADQSGFQGGPILLPPSYPQDPTVFAASGVGLQRSDDGGATFSTVAPPGAAAIDPASAPGDAHIVIASSTLLIYSARTGEVMPGALLPPTLGLPDQVAFVSGHDQVLVSAEQFDSTPTAQGEGGTVLACAVRGRCTEVARFPGDYPVQIAVSPTLASDQTVFIAATRHLEVSEDGGATFHLQQFPANAKITAVSMVPAHGASIAEIALAPGANGGDTAALLQMLPDRIDYRSWKPTGFPATMDMASLIHLADGRLLAGWQGGSSNQTFGLRCSSDGGMSWHMTC